MAVGGCWGILDSVNTNVDQWGFASLKKWLRNNAEQA
jgi:hypothetical protein